MDHGRFTEEFGAQGETLVLVHGLGGTTNTWYPQAQILKRDLRVIAYDLPGSGRTPVQGEVSIEILVADLHEVVEHSGSGRVHLGGHSLGTIICQHYAARYPDRVASLALLGAFPEPPEPARRALRDRAARVRTEGMAAIADAIVTAGTSDDTKANNPVAASFVRESIMAQPAEGYAPHLRGAGVSHPGRPFGAALPDAPADRRPGPHGAAGYRLGAGGQHPRRRVPRARRLRALGEHRAGEAGQLRDDPVLLAAALRQGGLSDRGTDLRLHDLQPATCLPKPARRRRGWNSREP